MVVLYYINFTTGAFLLDKIVWHADLLLYRYSKEWSSYLATTVRSAPVVSLHNVTLATAHSRRWSHKTKCIKIISNSEETGSGECTREGDHRLKV